MPNASKFNTQVHIVSNLPQNYKPNLKYFTSFLGNCMSLNLEEGQNIDFNTFHYYDSNSEMFLNLLNLNSRLCCYIGTHYY
jgi:hypothetical protein